MIVATRLWRSSLIFSGIFFISTALVQAMTWDNRYFPWIDQLYTGSDSSHANINVQPFFITGGDAFRYQIRSIRDEQFITFPELWGELDLAVVGSSIAKTGKKNPIPDDWLWLSEIKALMPASLEAQGGMISGYAPITKHFGIGASSVVMKLNSLVSVVPDQSTIDKLFLNTPGNQSVFTQTLKKIYQDIGINSTAMQQVGVGDTVLYVHLFDIHEYKYKFRKLDWGVWAGVIIPNGLKQDPHNLASVPFGGQYGGWAWFVAPRAEFELRDDLKFGIQARLTKRLGNCFQGRIPVGKEQVLFAPLIGKVHVEQGTTFGVSAYFVFEDIRAGLGAQMQYTINVHEHDSLSAKLRNLNVDSNFVNMNYFSGWTQEYFMFKLFYDIAHDKPWKNRPMAYFSWDIPMNHLFGRGFAKTHKIAIGCNVNF